MRHLFTAFLLTICLASQSQTAGGNAFRIDYEEFLENGNQVKHFNCGNNEILNTGDEMTVMAWVQLRTTVDDQKIVGKYNLNESGFSFGVIGAQVYPAVWNPTPYLVQDGQMAEADQYWYHVAMTYKSGDFLRSYLNGIEVGQYELAEAPIVPNDNDLIIGVSSWGNFDAFQTFGSIDELGIWNAALSEGEIKGQMFRPLAGDEAGLVAGYNFNETSGTSLSDISGNGNNGTGIGPFSGSEWIESHAPQASADLEEAIELHGLWEGVSMTDPRFVTTEIGMSLVAFNMDSAAYAVFGHNNLSGIVTDNIPSNAPINFQRAARIWPMTAFENPTTDVIISLENAAGGGEMLDAAQPSELYTLLWRDFEGGDFAPIASGASNAAGVIVFEDVSLDNGEYVVGLGDAIFQSVGENEAALAVSVFPNPSEGRIEIRLGSRAESTTALSLFDVSGSLVKSQLLAAGSRSTVLNAEDLPAGMYVLKIQNEGVVVARSLVVR